MTHAELASLKQAASRDSYASMAALARALYDARLTEREVVRNSYGVAFPDELFVIGEARRKGRVPRMLFTNQPWNLAVPPAHGGPQPTANAIDQRERETFARDPQLLPLIILQNPEYHHGDSLLCYRLDELAAGRATIIGLPRASDSQRGPTRYGSSLIAVLLEHYGDAARQLEKEYHRPYNRGAGSVDRDEVEGARENLTLIEAIARALHVLP